ncbi:Histone-lysine N-methyltransferase SUV39H2, partial [Stegodyphus mimosarum]
MPNSELCPISNSLEQIMLLYECRKVVLVKTAEWETSINSLNPTAFIKVENDVDLEEPPVDFQFIHDYISLNVDIHRQPLAFCCCDNCYENRHSCCPKDSDGHFAYDRYRRLMLLPGYPIYECNKLCKCPPTCVNRVVQHGQKVKVAIFRTSNGCGWGLKSLEMIQKDQFVLEYLGEIFENFLRPNAFLNHCMICILSED